MNFNAIKQHKKIWEELQASFEEHKIPAKTTLLREGDISQNIHYIKKGCLRMSFNDDGKDITFQFFFENQAVASIDSFLNKESSLFSIESIEPSTIYYISKKDFDRLMNQYPELHEFSQKYIIQRLRVYSLLFLSRIKDSPRKRYEDLLHNHPEILQRVPQHYIASYLGITPVSLSRIRNKR